MKVDIKGVNLNHIGIMYQSRLKDATELAKSVADHIRQLGKTVWVIPSSDKIQDAEISSTDLVISVGGDGTLLSVTRDTAAWNTPILGINAGSLGFLTELDRENYKSKLVDAFNGKGWIEDRSMLSTDIGGLQWNALNEIAVSRGGAARTIQINVDVDNTRMMAFQGDGLLVATATGSTAYNLAAGGPVLPPTAPYFIIKAISAHPLSQSALIVEPNATVEVELKGANPAVLSIDGHVDHDLVTGDRVKVSRSTHVAHFLRLRPPNYFYGAIHSILSGERHHPDFPRYLNDESID